MKSKTRKLIWSVPLMATLAVVGALAVFVALGLPNANPAEAQGTVDEPSAPQSATATLGNQKITVTWRPPSDPGVTAITGYLVQYVADATRPAADDDDWTNAPGTDDIAADARRFTITGLTNTTEYFVRVAARNGPAATNVGVYATLGSGANAGEQALETADGFEPAAVVPDAPVTVMVEQGDASTKVDVTWTEPSDDGGSDVTGYMIRIGTTVLTNAAATDDPVGALLEDCDPDTAGDQTCEALMTARTATVAGLAADESYVIEVAASNSATGDLNYKKAAEYTTKTPLHSGEVYSDSSSGGAAPEIRLEINPLQRDLPVGSSIALFLEADYTVPSSIPPGSIYFVAEGGIETPADPNASPPTLAVEQQTQTGMGARVKATASVRVDTDDYFEKNPNDKDSRILVQIPDMCTSSTDACQGPNGPYQGQKLTMVIEDSSGITNPGEGETDYKVAFSVLGPTESPPGPGNVKMISPERVTATGGSLDPEVMGTLGIAAKITLSDNKAKRGYEMTITGSGFNNDTTATAYVLNVGGDSNMHKWDALDCAEKKDAVMGKSPAPVATNTDGSGYCGSLDAARKAVVDGLDFSKGDAEAALCDAIIRSGSSLGGGLVGTDDKVSVAFTVAVPTFKAGGNNWVCMKDGENRKAGSDVENFFLEDSLRAVPDTVGAGDTVTLFAEDFMVGLGFIKVQLDGKDAPPSASVNGGTIRDDGSATVTFQVPGSIDNVPVQGTIKVEGFWGEADSPAKADAKITVSPATLTLSKTTARPNDTITIQGVGFGDATENDIAVSSILLDDVPLAVDDDSREGDEVTVSSAGQFVATVYLWQESGTSNPALTAGTHTIKVRNKAGFSGTATIIIPEPTIKVTPDVAGPRNYVEISGENWPVDNPESSASPDTVSITITEGSRNRRYSAIPDSAGRWIVEHRVGSAVAIPSTNQVKVEYGSEIAKVTSFKVPEASITVEPAEGKPGDVLSLTAIGMPVHSSVDEVKIGGRAVAGRLDFSTDREGKVTVTDIIVPGLDPGTYGIELNVNDIVAIGSLKVLPEGPSGTATALPAAVTNLGDKLVRVFHFNGVDKTWSFFDPGADFADLNTLTEMVNGEPYWILVTENVDDVVLNNKTRTFTCVGGDCWNQPVW